LKRFFHQLDSNTDRFLREISNWTPSQLRFRGSPTSWCALEVLDHVIKVESSIFVEMQKHLPQRLRPPRGDAFRCSIVNVVISSPLKVRVPPGVASIVLPEMRCDQTQLNAAWKTAREEMRTWLGERGPELANFRAFIHPVGGWMCLSQAFNFLACHVRHHEYQLKRIRKNPGWAASI
jgi:hypothetical protein